MQTAEQIGGISNIWTWIGRLLSGLVILFMLLDSAETRAANAMR